MRASPDHRPCGRLLHPLARHPVQSADHGPARRLARPAAALALLAALAACTPGAQERAPVATAQPATQPATAALGVPPATAATLPARWRVNALYVSVIDDDEPPRWAAPDRAGQCGPDTTLHVDGAPMREGERIPGPVFRLTWRIDRQHREPAGPDACRRPARGGRADRRRRALRQAVRIEVLAGLTWPWPASTLHWAYLTSGLLIAAHYAPLLKRAWRHPEATATAQSLLTWAVWTLCRVVAFTYGLFILHDLVFLIVVGADLIGRLAMAVLIVRARWLTHRRTREQAARGAVAAE